MSRGAAAACAPSRRGFRVAWIRVAKPGPCLADPPPHVQSKPGGGFGLPRLMLVKPDRTGDEILGINFQTDPLPPIRFS